MLSFSRLAPLPDLLDDLGQAVFAALEARLAKTRYGIGIIGMVYAFHQPDWIDQESTDDRTGTGFFNQELAPNHTGRRRLHHEPAGVVPFWLFTEVRCYKTQPVYTAAYRSG